MIRKINRCWFQCHHKYLIVCILGDKWIVQGLHFNDPHTHSCVIPVSTLYFYLAPQVIQLGV